MRNILLTFTLLLISSLAFCQYGFKSDCHKFYDLDGNALTELIETESQINIYTNKNITISTGKNFLVLVYNKSYEYLDKFNNKCARFECLDSKGNSVYMTLVRNGDELFWILQVNKDKVVYRIVECTEIKG